MSKSKKRVFDAVEALNSQDRRASQKQKTSSKEIRKSKAAQSQLHMFQKLMEIRILLQRAVINEANSEELLLKLQDARRKLRGDDSGDSDDKCGEDWKEVLDRRYKDLRLHSGLTAKAQFKMVDSGFWEQVRSTAQHELAIKSSGGFDDSKLYRYLLQEYLVGKKEQSSTERRKATNKAKKNVDRKASKGRKLRYTVHPKIVNFTFPMSRPSPPGMTDDEFFKSLFGGVSK